MCLLTPPYLPLCVHLQDVHHIDLDVLVRFLVFPHSERYGEPAGSTRAHAGFAALLPPLTHLKCVRIHDTDYCTYRGHSLEIEGEAAHFNSSNVRLVKTD